jgi:predicted metal-dependent phosphoesterase TrpH
MDELVAEAATAGLTTLALTDHDTTAGWEQAREAAARHGVAVVPGIEVSCEYEERSVHVLALWIDPSEDTELAGHLRRARDSRRDRARAMTALLAQDFPITWADVRAQVTDESSTVGRPHLADALVARGAFPDRSAAFAGPLAADGPYYVHHDAPDPATAVQAIRTAGGVAIAAHPASEMRGRAGADGIPRELLVAMVEAGLNGVEVEHREHDEATRAALREFVAEHDLVATGGSDYHGTGKPNVLGENLTSAEALAALQEQVTSGVGTFGYARMD